MSSAHVILSNPWTDNIGEKFVPKEHTGISERALKIARTELREDEHIRKHSLQQFREWIKKNQDLENCFTDDRFLLRFLRVKKFSLPMAEQTLLKYLNYRKRFNEFMYGLDYRTNSLIDDGYIFATPVRDAQGRRVVVCNLDKIDPHKHTSKEIFHAHTVTYETLVNDEENQIVGFNHVANLNGFSPAFLTLASIPEVATLIRWGEQSAPMRHKEINVLNFPVALKFVYDFAQSNMKSQKLKDRIKFHDSHSELHKKVNKHCLPLELGGIMPAKDMVELWKKELEDQREMLMTYDNMNLLSDRGIIRKGNVPAQDDTESVQGSFRKLIVD